MCLPAVWGILSPRPGCTMEGLKMLLPRSWRWSSKVLQALALLADLGLLNVPGLLPLGYRGWVSSRQEGSCFAIGPKAALTSLWPGGDMDAASLCTSSLSDVTASCSEAQWSPWQPSEDCLCSAQSRRNQSPRGSFRDDGVSHLPSEVHPFLP